MGVTVRSFIGDESITVNGIGTFMPSLWLAARCLNLLRRQGLGNTYPRLQKEVGAWQFKRFPNGPLTVLQPGQDGGWRNFPRRILKIIGDDPITVNGIGNTCFHFDVSAIRQMLVRPQGLGSFSRACTEVVMPANKELAPMDL